MDYTIRIKHCIDGYERVVTPSEYNEWRMVEQKSDKPIFQVMGFIVGEKYIDIKQMVDMFTNGGN
jgi:hypothetical protein